MPWGTWTLNTETTIRLGTADIGNSLKGLTVSGQVSVTIDSLLYSPMTAGLLELNNNNQLVALGTSPDFPMGPKWRKVVRQIG